MPQGSILRPLFLIIKNCDIPNYADDNTPYSRGKNVEEVLNRLENMSSNLFQWFTEDEFKAKSKKMSFSDKLWRKYACKYRHITD